MTNDDSSATFTLLTDQRGWPRTIDGDVDGSVICDLGAFEAPPPYQFWLPLISQ